MYIRKAKKKDFKAFNHCILKLNEFHEKNHHDIEKLDKYTKKEYEKLLKTNKIFVAINDNDKVIGMLKLSLPKYNVICPTISALYVKSKYRNLGVGTLLMQYCLDYCKKHFVGENYYDYLDLCVWDFNENAMKFYEKIGFQPKFHFLEFNYKDKNSF